MPEASLLQVRGVSKRFTGTLALDAIDVDVRGGEIHALLGQNGAGKSTLIKILAGVYPPSAGRIVWQGREVAPTAERLPIAFIHQDLGLVDAMTVAENVAIQAGYQRAHGLIDWRASAAAAARALAAMGSLIDPQTRVAALSAADRSIVAIARALAVQAEMLVLDEPTAALPAEDVARLLDTLRRLRARGIGMIYVTHRLDEVFLIADRVTVLRDGRRIATRAVAETSPSDLVQMIVGRAVAEAGAAPPPAARSSLLSVEQAVVPQEEAGLIGPVSFAAAAGEVLALVGLRGAGHHAIGRAIFGAMRLRAGRILLDGAPLVAGDPAAAMAAGIGFVSSRRGEESLATGMTVQENLISTRAPAASRRGSRCRRVANWRVRCARSRGSPCARLIRRARSSRSVAATSRKSVLARWMEARIRLLILEEPTIGVDVDSKAEISATSMRRCATVSPCC